jgi:hypothetical protein
VTCTKTEPKNDLFLNCRRKTKELSKIELSNVAPASISSYPNQTVNRVSEPEIRYLTYVKLWEH